MTVNQERADLLIRRMEARMITAREIVKAFSTKLEEDPAGAFEHGDHAVQAAAEIDVRSCIVRTIESLTYNDGYDSVEQAHDELTRTAMLVAERALCPSVYETRNLMRTAIAKKWFSIWLSDFRGKELQEDFKALADAD